MTRVAVGLVVLAAALAAPCDQPVVNQIACENSKPGVPPGTWEVEGAGSDALQGYATSMSVDKGDTVAFKINA